MIQKEPEMKKISLNPLACAYIRYSDIKQEGKNSFEVQLSEIQNAVERNDHYLPEKFIFVDKHVSAYHKKAGQRPSLNELKETVKTNPDIEYIYFYDYSRLDRTVYSFVEDFYFDLKQHSPDIQIFLCTTNSIFDPDDPRTKLEFILASYESAKKARTITDTQNNLIKVMKRPGARAPFGYDMKHKKLYPNEDALIVIWIFFLYSWGTSMNKIAQILNVDNLSPPHGTKWRSNTVEQILSNDIYIGRLTWKFESRIALEYEFDNAHEPIVPPFLYTLIQVNKKLKNKVERLDTPFLLANLIDCSNCRLPLTTRNSSTKKNGKTYSYRYYQCHSCNYSIDAENIQVYLLTDLSAHLKNQLDKIQQNTLSFILECKKHIQEALLNKQDDFKRIQSNHTFIIETSAKLPIELEQIVQNAMRSLTKEIMQLEKDLKNIQRLNNEKHLSFFFSQFTSIDLTKLTASEQRFITALFIGRVSVSNKGSYQIHFKEQPFEL